MHKFYQRQESGGDVSSSVGIGYFFRIKVFPGVYGEGHVSWWLMLRRALAPFTILAAHGEEVEALLIGLVQSLRPLIIWGRGCCLVLWILRRYLEGNAASIHRLSR